MEDAITKTPSDRWQSGGVDLKAFQRAAVELLIRFHIVDKISKIHDPKNDAFQEQGQLLFGSLMRLLQEEEEVSFRVRHSSLLLSGVRIKSSLGTYPIFKSVLEEFRLRELDALAFKPGLTLEELYRFMPIFARRDKKEGSMYTRLQAEIDAADISHVVLEKASLLKTPSNLNRNTARIFFLSIVHLKESFKRNQKD